MIGAAFLQESSGFSVVVQARSSNQVMAADTVQPRARWGMFLRGEPLWVEGGEKEIGKYGEEGTWGERSENSISHAGLQEASHSGSAADSYLFILARPSPPGSLSLSAGDISSLLHLPQISSCPAIFLLILSFRLCQEPLTSSNQNPVSFLPSEQQTDLPLNVRSPPFLLLHHALNPTHLLQNLEWSVIPSPIMPTFASPLDPSHRDF